MQKSSKKMRTPLNGELFVIASLLINEVVPITEFWKINVSGMPIDRILNYFVSP